MDSRESPEQPSRGDEPDTTASFALGPVATPLQGVLGAVPPGDNSGVGVLDKAVSVLAAVESGPATLAQLVGATGLARPTTHRIAVALEHHRLLARDVQGRFILGPRIAELASAAGEDRMLAVAQPVLAHLRDLTGESAQLYRRQSDVRVC